MSHAEEKIPLWWKQAKSGAGRLLEKLADIARQLFQYKDQKPRFAMGQCVITYILLLVLLTHLSSLSLMKLKLKVLVPMIEHLAALYGSLRTQR